jgi:hypothetical protein
VISCASIPTDRQGFNAGVTTTEVEEPDTSFWVTIASAAPQKDEPEPSATAPSGSDVEMYDGVAAAAAAWIVAMVANSAARIVKSRPPVGTPGVTSVVSTAPTAWTGADAGAADVMMTAASADAIESIETIDVPPGKDRRVAALEITVDGATAAKRVRESAAAAIVAGGITTPFWTAVAIELVRRDAIAVRVTVTAVVSAVVRLLAEVRSAS